MTVYETARTELGVAQVAALLGFGVLMMGYIFPLVWLPVVLALCRSRLNDIYVRTHLERLAHETIWPQIIGFYEWCRIDRKLDFEHVRLVGMRVLKFFVQLLLVLSSFLLAMPLHERFVPSDKTISADFSYSRDFSYYGQATTRPVPPATIRLCGLATALNCPGAEHYKPTNNESYYDGFPDHVREAFSPKKKGRTIASPFDIKYRTTRKSPEFTADQSFGERRMTIGDYQPLVSHALDNDFTLVEGLIIDTIHGGIGFRNHTIPETKLGAEWQEDLLWITPVTACTDTNLTFHYTLSNNDTISNGYMQDDGGMAMLSGSVPAPRWDRGGWAVSPAIPDLSWRSYNLAWWNNKLTAKYLGQAPGNGDNGRRYSKRVQNYFFSVNPGGITISLVDGWYLGQAFSGLDKAYTADFSLQGGPQCSGYDESLEAAVGVKPFIRCGYLYGIPYPDDGHPWTNDFGSKRTQKLYTCASSVKASIKSVKFEINDTASLNAVRVVELKDREYNDTDEPLWGIERAPELLIRDINRVWGLIREEYRESPLLDTMQAPGIFLPAAAIGSNTPFTAGNRFNRYLKDARDLFAAGSALTAAWNDVYDRAAGLGGIALDGTPSYSGRNNYAQTLKWRSLGADSDGAALILNLIWTDLVSFGIISTKTGFESIENSQLTQGVLGKRSIRPLTHQLIFSNPGYLTTSLLALAAFVIFAIMSGFVFIASLRGNRILTWATFKEVACA